MLRYLAFYISYIKRVCRLDIWSRIKAKLMILSNKCSQVFNFYGKTKGIFCKGMENLGFRIVFRQQIRSVCNPVLLMSVCLLPYVNSTTQMLCWIKLQERGATGISMCYDLVFCSLRHWTCFISSLLSFTWSRNMKKDSVSCIIWNRQILMNVDVPNMHRFIIIN
jgi:hypothetical protein